MSRRERICSERDLRNVVYAGQLDDNIIPREEVGVTDINSVDECRAIS